MVNTVAKKIREILMQVPRRSCADQKGLRYDGVFLNQAFKNMVHCTLISNCTILSDDIATTNKIHSPNFHSVKGGAV